MRAKLAKIALRKAVGLYLGDHEVAVCEVASTPLGPIQLSSHSEPCSPSELINVIERVLESLLGEKKRRLSVAIGIPTSRVFFGTRPLRGVTDPTPEAMMQKLLCSANISVDDLTIDMMRGSISKQPVASVAACRKKYMSAVLAVLERCGCQIVRAEPAPCAMVRATAQQIRPPRKAKSLLRVFLEGNDGMAVLSIGGDLVGWRPFNLMPGMEGIAILSAGRTLLSQNKYYGLETTLDYVMVHGRADLHETLQKEELPSELGTRVLWNEGPKADSSTIAYGLALGGLSQNAATFDLARLMKPHPSLKDIFPYGELAIQCAMMLFMALILAHQSRKLDAANLATNVECSRNKILATAKASDLMTEKKVLTEKVKALHGFLNTRIPWATYTRDIATLLPPNVRINQFTGVCALPNAKSGGGGSKQSLRLVGEAAVVKEGKTPPEVGNLLVMLRNHPRIKRDFPNIQLSDVKQGQSKAGKDSVAMPAANFSIVCLPDNTKGPKKK
jgi:hypothetical protein